MLWIVISPRMNLFTASISRWIERVSEQQSILQFFFRLFSIMDHALLALDGCSINWSSGSCLHGQNYVVHDLRYWSIVFFLPEKLHPHKFRDRILLSYIQSKAPWISNDFLLIRKAQRYSQTINNMFTVISRLVDKLDIVQRAGGYSDDGFLCDTVLSLIFHTNTAWINLAQFKGL